MSSWYFYTWSGDKTDKWGTHLAESKAEVLESVRPTFVTILDVNYSFTEGTVEPSEGLRYRGPMYFDWDGKDGIDSVLESVREFMEYLETQCYFNLNEASWYLTGGRGVHCTIPPECFLDGKLIRAGISDLPLLYRRFAFEHVTDYLDLRVYTGKRGRQWRTGYNPRTTQAFPTYKVQVHPDEIKSMDEDTYWEKCKTQCLSIPVDKPTFNHQLGTELMAMWDDLKTRTKKSSKSHGKVFEGWSNTPPTIQAAFNGENVNMNCDLNDIKLQLATAALATGMTDVDQFLEKCSGFIKARAQMSGVAHKTERTIRRELENTFNYLNGNSAYVYEPRAFESILTADSQGQMDVQGVPEDECERARQNDAAETKGVLADKWGVVKQTKDGIETISDYSWALGSLAVVVDDDGTITEMSAVPVVKGKEMPRVVLDSEILFKPAKLQQHVTSYQAFAHLTTPVECQKVVAAIRKAALQGEEATVIYPARSEGLFLGPSGETLEDGTPIYNTFWIDPTNQFGSPLNLEKLSNGEPARNYIYVDHDNRMGVLGSEMCNVVRPTAETPKFREVIDALLNVNGSEYTLGILLGWLSACLVRQPLLMHNTIQNFPILQVVGQAGSGKTTQLRALMNLYPRRNNDVLSALATTIFGVKSFVGSSSTLPVILDEYKEQNLAKSGKIEQIKALILECYTPNGLDARGSGSGSGSSYRTISITRGAGPLALIAELYESSQSAIVERSVKAEFSKVAIAGRRQYVETLQQSSRQLAMLGRYMVERIMETPIDEQIARFTKVKEHTIEAFSMGTNDRPVANAAIVIYGYDFIQQCIEELFPGEFTQRLDAIKEALLRQDDWQLRVQTEVARLLTQLSSLSFNRGLVGQKDVFLLGSHYKFGYFNEDRSLTISVDQAFPLYRQYMRQLGLSPAFNTSYDMAHAMKHSSAALDADYDPKMGQVVVFSLQGLIEEGVPAFKE